ncbi:MULTISPECIES: phage antirepressor KilAC domain-containing protein [Pseudomonas]|uniref:phage antirepressor KilAC domain-containing protein n=1 Tax=Pseudomonas TaxID=286 RepID=UPI000B35FB49|nr:MULTISPECIES: phage antirepressor KilAC domain-containing protein [Pseudomonas]PMY56127.1 DNA-binding protein [Pseudomonas sp. FW305-53]PMY88994.1 DNA-binding protein [Pseudomonas sp. FW303-C2]PMY92175.1 DNA-binding protein [Pseudomonas sp. FW305-62]PNA46248.1 DNA-binding protein [Pseudomonas sp. FW306-2-2C-A10BC]PNA89047.1 DNA-binding protein [Pseudomonas sp. MPR-R3B]
MDRTLAQAANHLGLTRPKLISQMREKGLLNERNLPAYPHRDREYLKVKDGQWYHEQLGMQYSQSTRIKQPGIRWLAEQLGLSLPEVPVDSRDVA